MNLATLFEPERKPVSQADLFKEAASRAGRSLAIRRWVNAAAPDRRTWTGIVFDGRRSWIGQPVVFADARVGWIKKAQAGFVCVRTAVVDPVGGPVHQYLEASALRPYRLPEAVLLGSLKRGKKERKSAAKAAAARRNGLMPVKPDRRRRGRPGKSK